MDLYLSKFKLPQIDPKWVWPLLMVIDMIFYAMRFSLDAADFFYALYIISIHFLFTLLSPFRTFKNPRQIEFWIQVALGWGIFRFIMWVSDFFNIVERLLT